MNEVEALKDQKEELTHEITNIHEDNSDTAATHVLRFDLILAWEAKEVVISCLKSQIKHKTNKLNLGDPETAARLEKMKNDNWFSIQLNMHALRDQIVAKIQEHKFEVMNLDHAVHTQAMGELKYGEHVFLNSFGFHRSCYMGTCQKGHYMLQPHCQQTYLTIQQAPEEANSTCDHSTTHQL
jgi:hypothetical protein